MATRACWVSYLRAMRQTLSEVKVTDSRSLNRKGQAMGCVRFSTLLVSMLFLDDLSQWALPALYPAPAVFLPIMCILGPIDTLGQVVGQADKTSLAHESHPDCECAVSLLYSPPAAC